MLSEAKHPTPKESVRNINLIPTFTSPRKGTT